MNFWRSSDDGSQMGKFFDTGSAACSAAPIGSLEECGHNGGTEGVDGEKGREALSLKIPHNASAKATAPRTRASRSEDRVVIKEPILRFDTV